jgi:holliday junction DNA helicase RuvA
MIARLSGTLLEKQPPLLLIEVSGVGYECEAPMSTFYDLPAVGSAVTVLTHFLVKEDAQQLFAFLTAAERSMFRTLLKLSGIGAKTALSVLSSAAPDEFSRLIQTGDVSSLTKIPGVGKKTAERMVLELKDKLGAGDVGSPLRARSGLQPQDPISEASVALVALGYRPQEVQTLLGKIEAPGLSAEELIRKALQAALRR